jgi:hypothetical protein
MHELPIAETSLLRKLQRNYASLSAWMVRDNRTIEAARTPSEPRVEAAARTHVASRPFFPSRPTKNFIEPV